MKKILKVALVATGIFSFGRAYAHSMPQDSIKHKVSKTAKTVGHATAHAAAAADAAVTDKKYDGKYGPEGQTIYINKHSHYFYISKTGHRVYLKKSQLRDKPTG